MGRKPEIQTRGHDASGSTLRSLCRLPGRFAPGLLAAAMICMPGVAPAEPEAVEIVVDVREVLSHIERKPGGFVTCWLMDSDAGHPRATSMAAIYQRLGVESVRYPYGHLANNYLWTSPPYERAAHGLVPRVASMSHPPAKWEWAVNPDGTFIKGLDFDEFMEQCRKAAIEPVIVINVMAHKYHGGPSLESLREAAVEWVRYANVTRSYGVRYWQLGNEQDHHPKLMTLDEYLDIYGDFSKAMKAVDPAIQTGVAITGNVLWARTLLENFPEHVDFIGCHQYQWKGWAVRDWVEQEQPLIPHALRIENVIRNSPRPDAGLMITETSSFGKWHDGPGKPDIMRALCFAEMLLHYATIENLSFAHFWCTHNAWAPDNVDEDIASALTLANEPKPNAVVIGLINRSLGSRMVQANRVAGPVRAFASHSADDDRLVVYLINKSDMPVAANILIKCISPREIESRTVYAGTGYDDLDPKMGNDQDATLSGGRAVTTLPEVSLTILILRGPVGKDGHQELLQGNRNGHE